MNNFANLLSAERPFRLAVGGLPTTVPVLVLAPHPDDFDAIGITLRQFHEHGNQVHVAVLSSASGVDDVYGGKGRLTAMEKSRIRQAEQRRSCELFGLPAECLGFPDLVQDAEWQPTVCPDNVTSIARLLAQTAAGFVFLPHGCDSNVGHQAVYALFRQAAARCGWPLAAFYIKDPKTLAMRIDVYVPFGAADAEWKGSLLRCHDSQQQRNLNTRGTGFDTRILKVNQAIASELGLAEPYAEAFELEFFSN